MVVLLTPPTSTLREMLNVLWSRDGISLYSTLLVTYRFKFLSMQNIPFEENLSQWCHLLSGKPTAISIDESTFEMETILVVVRLKYKEPFRICFLTISVVSMVNERSSCPPRDRRKDFPWNIFIKAKLISSWSRKIYIFIIFQQAHDIAFIVFSTSISSHVNNKLFQWNNVVCWLGKLPSHNYWANNHLWKKSLLSSKTKYIDLLNYKQGWLDFTWYYVITH